MSNHSLLYLTPTPRTLQGIGPLPIKPDPIPRLPMTPPNTYQSTETDERRSLQTALHTMCVERDALDHLQNAYATSGIAQKGLHRAVDAIIGSQQQGGKLIVCGVGKSAIVGRKVVATLTSLHIQSQTLDPLAALHGDLGMITEKDALMVISNSGRTQELTKVISIISSRLRQGYLPLIAVTNHMDPIECELFDHYPRQSCILLPTPVLEPEIETFGIPVPTTSTIVALAILDALALVVVEKMHSEPDKIFQRYHPGGTIGGEFGDLRCLNPG